MISCIEGKKSIPEAAKSLCLRFTKSIVLPRLITDESQESLSKTRLFYQTEAAHLGTHDDSLSIAITTAI